MSGHLSGWATPSLRGAPIAAHYDSNRQRLHLSGAKRYLDEAGHLSERTRLAARLARKLGELGFDVTLTPKDAAMVSS